MQPQGAGLINAAYFANLTTQINALQGTGACAALQVIVNEAFASIQAQVTAAEQQIAKLETLITIPTSLSGVIAWITAQVAPYEVAYANYAAQLTATLAQMTALASAIEAAAARLTSCSITIPTLT